MVEWKHQGKLIHEVSLAGEGRQQMVVPNHCNGMQLSEDRCLSLVSTVGYRGVDDARSIVYQLRDRTFDGPILREGFLAQSIDDWDPHQDGSRLVRQFGHPAGLGVPLGARQAGRTLAHENVFAVMFRQCPRMFNQSRSCLLWENHPHELTRTTQGVLIVQFRLNEARDDIEIIDGPRLLRQKGHEQSEAICQRVVGHMNQSISNPVPWNEDASEWVVVNHFGGAPGGAKGGLATLRFGFNATQGLYEWLETGPVFGEGYFEASIVRHTESYVIVARPLGSGHPGWARVSDPLKAGIELVPCTDIFNRAPLTAYAAADGVLRFLSGDSKISPHAAGRDPLYCWEIDPDRGFAVTQRHMIFDTSQAGIPIARKHGPKVDFARLLPHVGGDVQVLTHRVSSCGFPQDDVDLGGRPHPLPPQEFDATGVYHAHLKLAEPLPGAWVFR